MILAAFFTSLISLTTPSICVSFITLLSVNMWHHLSLLRSLLLWQCCEINVFTNLYWCLSLTLSLSVLVLQSWRAWSVGVMNVKNIFVITGFCLWGYLQVPLSLCSNSHDVLTLKLTQAANIIEVPPFLSYAVRMTLSILPLSAKKKTKAVIWSWHGWLWK